MADPCAAPKDRPAPTVSSSAWQNLPLEIIAPILEHVVDTITTQYWYGDQLESNARRAALRSLLTVNITFGQQVKYAIASAIRALEIRIAQSTTRLAIFASQIKTERRLRPGRKLPRRLAEFNDDKIFSMQWDAEQEAKALRDLQAVVTMAPACSQHAGAPTLKLLLSNEKRNGVYHYTVYELSPMQIRVSVPLPSRAVRYSSTWG